MTENQDVTMNDVQRAFCEKHHLDVKPYGDGFIVIDRDPVLRAKKVKLPRHNGIDLDSLIFAAIAEQNARNGVSVVEPEPEVEVETEEVVEEEVVEEEIETEPEVEEEVEPPTNIVPLRRVVIETPTTLRDVILDNTGKKERKVKSERKHRDNRYARAFRALLENPGLTVAEQAKIADVSVPMFIWYDITFRAMYRIIYEKHGEDVIPALPKLTK
jgi:hypothetical protein